MDLPNIDIKTLRERRGWTQEQLAEYLGLDRSSVSRMENGQPPKGSTRKLLDELVKGQSTEASAPPFNRPEPVA